jgi:hypothetical protein
LSFVSCVDADADEKLEKRRHSTDSDSNFFESNDSNDETSFIDASFRKKHRKSFEKTKKKKSEISSLENRRSRLKRHVN